MFQMILLPNYFAKATITKPHRGSGLNNSNVLTFLCSKTRCWQGWFLRGRVSSACRRPPSPCASTRSPVHTHHWCLFLCPNSLFSQGHRSDQTQSHPQRAHEHHHLSKGLVSKRSHNRRFWGLDLQHMDFRGTQFSP